MTELASYVVAGLFLVGFGYFVYTRFAKDRKKPTGTGTGGGGSGRDGFDNHQNLQ